LQTLGILSFNADGNIESLAELGQQENVVRQCAGYFSKPMMSFMFVGNNWHFDEAGNLRQVIYGNISDKLKNPENIMKYGAWNIVVCPAGPIR
jgi:hypothetical protein